MTTDIKTGYKQTKIGIIPNDWDSDFLVNVVDITTGKKDVNEGNPQGRYPFYTCAKEITYSDSYSFDTEAILVSGNGVGVGYTNYYNGKFEAYQRTYVLNNFRKVQPKYLLYILGKDLRAKIMEEKGGSAMPYIRLGTLETFPVKHPTNPAEQEKIANILSSVDELIEKTDKIIDTQKKLKDGLLSKLMREGVKIKTQKLKDIAKFSQGIQVDLEQQKTHPSEGYIRFLRIVDYTQETKDLRYINFPGEKYIANEDDVVMVRYGASAGFIGTGKKGVIANNMFKIDTNGEVLSKYLYFFLKQNKVGKIITQMSTASAMPQLNFTMVGGIEITYPEDIQEQQKIVDMLISIDSSIKDEENYKNLLKTLKKGLMDKLLVGEIRVKL